MSTSTPRRRFAGRKRESWPALTAESRRVRDAAIERGVQPGPTVHP